VVYGQHVHLILFTPMRRLFWDNLKDSVYRTNPNTEEELKENIRREIQICFQECTALMMEAARTSETSVDNYFTRQYIPEDRSELHTRRRENFKSHIRKEMLEIPQEEYRLNSSLSVWYRTGLQNTRPAAPQKIFSIQGRLAQPYPGP
jgi:hypothetical protein